MRLLLIFAALLPAAVAAQTPRPITTDDYHALKAVGDPVFSPDGKWLAYPTTRVDRAANRRVTTISLVPSDGSTPPRPMTANSVSSSGPSWSPDGRMLAFYSVRPLPGDDASARSQLYLLSLEGGEPRRLTSLANGVSGCVWAPDGSRLVCLSRTGPSDRRTGPPSSDARHYTQIRYKFNDTGWFDDKRSHLWIVDAKTGAATQLTSGDDWNDTDPQWSPDGTRISFTSNRTGKEYDLDDNSEVWVIPATGGELVRISDHPKQDGTGRWSPDGKSIAFLGRIRDTDPAAIWLAPASGGAPSVLLYPSDELFPQGLRWAEGGRAIYFTAEQRGEAQVFRLDVATKAVRPITSGARLVRSLDVDQGSGRIAYLASDFTHPDEVFVAGPDGKGERRLSRENDAFLAGLSLVPLERIRYRGADGWDIDGFLAKPLGWQPGKSYPLILSIHGGPAGMYGVGWFHEFQVYAAKGWGVFFTNPRGSTGYGHRFERGIFGEWGGKDYLDVMNGVDQVIKANAWVDTTRLGVTGGSYGGYLTNWIVGHTNRFKAAVTLRSVVSFLSDEGTRDGAYGHADDFGGDLFEKFDLYWDRSPLKYAKNVSTPILILHADNDFRVPLEQGEQWFRALKWYGKTAEIVMFPRENHNQTRTGEPKHLVESLDWQVYWFSKYLDGRTDAVAPDRR